MGGVPYNILAMDRIYFDYASTTPTDPKVIEAMEPYFYQRFGNASSPHKIGQEAKNALEESRSILAHFIGAKEDEIVFNSGATEGNNHVISRIAVDLKGKGNHIIVSPIEHHSVLESLERLQKNGYKITYLKPSAEGLVDLQEIKDSITDQTILIAVMYANNEIGTIQSVADIGQMAKEKDIAFLVDAVQAVGHVPVDVNAIQADYLTLSAHKFYGPKGVGALYMKKGKAVSKLLLGGDQENNFRASTQNVAGIVGLAKAIELCRDLMDQEIDEQTRLRDYLKEGVLNAIDGVNWNGHPTQRLPNNAHFSFEKLSGESLLMSLDMEGICASMGSACTSGAMEPSHVLKAIGVSDDLAFGSLRITLGRWTTQKEIDYFLEKLPQIVTSLRI